MDIVAVLCRFRDGWWTLSSPLDHDPLWEQLHTRVSDADCSLISKGMLESQVMLVLIQTMTGQVTPLGLVVDTGANAHAQYA